MGQDENALRIVRLRELAEHLTAVLEEHGDVVVQVEAQWDGYGGTEKRAGLLQELPAMFEGQRVYVVDEGYPYVLAADEQKVLLLRVHLP